MRSFYSLAENEPLPPLRLFMCPLSCCWFDRRHLAQRRKLKTIQLRRRNTRFIGYAWRISVSTGIFFISFFHVVKVHLGKAGECSVAVAAGQASRPLAPVAAGSQLLGVLHLAVQMERGPQAATAATAAAAARQLMTALADAAQVDGSQEDGHQQDACGRGAHGHEHCGAHAGQQHRLESRDRVIYVRVLT